MDDEKPDGPYFAAIRRGFQFARETGRECGPAEFLVGVAEGHGAAAAALVPEPGLGPAAGSRADAGRSLRAVAAAAGNPRCGGGGYLHMQAQGAARSLADALGQPLACEHLLIALIDQNTPEVAELLERAALDPAAVRRAALAGLGAPADLPQIPLPALTPAGTLDRAPLPVADLDGRAWRVLRWRQDHLPTERLRRAGDREALEHLERAEAWRLGERLGLDDDQRYSLVSHHSDQVRRLAGRGRRPEVVPRHRPPRGLLRLTVGWRMWFGNRWAGLRDRWFRLRTLRHYRGRPQP